MSAQQILLVGVSGAAPAGSTWNPSDKDAGITLSNGNLTAANVTGTGMVRGQTSRAAGVWQYEVLAQVSNGWLFGIATSGATITERAGVCGDGLSWAYSHNQFKWNAGTPTSYGAGFTVDDIIGVVYDGTSGTLTFYKNGSTEGTAYSGLSGSMFPAFSSYDGADEACTLNTGGTAFAFPIGGATAWG